MKIGVFDSGVGGLSVVNAIKRALPELVIDYREDREHVPYGNKPMGEVYDYVLPILQAIVAGGARVIVIACNTVTTNLIEKLRKEVPVPLIGMEPMIKPAAAQTKTGVIAVCATPATLRSRRYAYLKDTFAADVRVLEPNCSDWAAMIEQSAVNKDVIADRLGAVLTEKADVIVLGCTHYHWIEQEIREIAAGKALVLQPETPVLTELKRVLAQLA